MNNYRSLNPTKWECQYHVVFIPKYRRKTMYGGLRHYLGDLLRRLAEQRESRVEEGHLLADHVHMLVSIPPKYSVAQVIGYIKGRVRSTLLGSLRAGPELRGATLLGTGLLRHTLSHRRAYRDLNKRYVGPLTMFIVSTR